MWRTNSSKHEKGSTNSVIRHILPKNLTLGLDLLVVVIRLWQMHMFLDYCYPLGLYGTLTSQARTCTHIALKNFLCCDLVVTS